MIDLLKYIWNLYSRALLKLQRTHWNYVKPMMYTIITTKNWRILYLNKICSPQVYIRVSPFKSIKTKNYKVIVSVDWSKDLVWHLSIEFPMFTGNGGRSFNSSQLPTPFYWGNRSLVSKYSCILCNPLCCLKRNSLLKG